MQRDHLRYALQLEMLERDGALGDEQAIELLRREFALAQNAARFDAVAADDLQLGSIERSTPQEGVTRFTAVVYLVEREAGLDDARAAALLRQAFVDALNASYFMRVCLDDDVTLELLSRTPAAVPGLGRRAA